MDYVKPQLPSKPKQKQPKPKPKQKQTAKCSWCDRKRARNDLCNVCRQKVESRARRLMEQKLEGDMEVVQKVMKYLNQNIPLNQLHNEEILTLILECFPFLMLKFQSENTYRGKKGNRCWCLPESVLKKLISNFYEKDTQSNAIIKKGGRQELCDLLMSSVSKHFSQYGINNIQPLNEQMQTNNTQMKAEANSGKTRNLKRRSMDNMANTTHIPPRKRTRLNNNNNNHNVNDSEVRIWGRSDTELLSFDITKLDSFLHQFENKVLNGAELQRVEPQQRVDFLKKRCKEFVKILTELRDYVLHLRSKVMNENSNEDHSIILNAKNREIAQLKKRIGDLSDMSRGTQSLMRCTTNLLSKLAPNPVDTDLLRSNADKLEQYHNLACNELLAAIHCFEFIGAKMGYNRSSNMTLKQYASHLQQNIVNNNNNNSNSQLNTLYIDSKPNNNSNTPNITPSTASINSINIPMSMSLSANNNTSNNNTHTFNLSSFNNNNNNRNIQPQQQSILSPNNQRIFTNTQLNYNTNPSIANTHSINFNHNHTHNNRQQLHQMQAMQQQIQQFNTNSNVSTNRNNVQNNVQNNNNNNIGPRHIANTQQILLTPITTNTYPIQFNNNNHNINNNSTMLSPAIGVNAATLQSLGITIPTITSIMPGQHLPTTFNMDFFN